MSTIKDIEKMTLAQLREELKKKDLPVDGKKSVLIDRLMKAQEDALLNTTADSDPAPSDDILKSAEDLLGDAASTTGTDVEPEKEKTTHEEKEAKENGTEDEKSNKPKVTAPVDETAEAKMKRAARFGLPVGPEVALDDAKKKRAERFGLPTAAAPASTDSDVIAKRKERFGGATSPIVKPSAVADEATKEKLIKRAQRFGIPVNADGKTVAAPVVSADALAKRAARFGINGSGNEELDAKKKARLERFGGQ